MPILKKILPLSGGLNHWLFISLVFFKHLTNNSSNWCALLLHNTFIIECQLQFQFSLWSV